jgi:hypothetical protein
MGAAATKSGHTVRSAAKQRRQKHYTSLACQCLKKFTNLAMAHKPGAGQIQHRKSLSKKMTL